MNKSYIMESEEEIHRLEMKTDTSSVLEQARWAGLSNAMRVLDVGCGTGKTTCALSKLVDPAG